MWYVFWFLFHQILNLTQALRDGKSPVQLVQMPVVTVERKKMGGRTRADSNDIYTQSFSHRAPFFSWCWPRSKLGVGECLKMCAQSTGKNGDSSDVTLILLSCVLKTEVWILCDGYVIYSSYCKFKDKLQDTYEYTLTSWLD